MSAHGGNSFMHELLTVVAHEVRQVVTAAELAEVTVSEGAYPDGDSDDVYVIIPHEYSLLIPPPEAPTAEQLQRTIGFCVEHPGTAEFKVAAAYAARLACCVDINDESTLSLNRLGVRAERFVLGYSDRWDAWGGSADDRAIDLVYLGTEDVRRSRLLATDFEVLDEYEVLLATPTSEPRTRPKANFFMGDDKLRLLANSKILLNLHRGDSRAFEWVRYLEAAINGCVVVSEHSPDFAPLEPGRHVVFGSPASLPHLAQYVLSEPSLGNELRAETYDYLKTNLRMADSARMLADLALEVAAGRPSSPGKRAKPAQPNTPTAAPQTANSVVVSPTSPPARSWPLRSSESGHRPPHPRGFRDHLSSIVIVDDIAPDPGPCIRALRRALRYAGVPIALIAPDPLEIPEAIAENVTVRVAAAGSDFDQALSECLASGQPELVLVLRSRDLLAGNAVRRLEAALFESGADAAYGMVADAASGILNAQPWDVDRPTQAAGMVLPSLWRRTALMRIGGLTATHQGNLVDAAELWQRLASQGGTAELVPRLLSREVGG